MFQITHHTVRINVTPSSVTSRLQFILYILCEISQKFAFLPRVLSVCAKQTPDDDLLDRNT
jgi:hypothetical protein